MRELFNVFDCYWGNPKLAKDENKILHSKKFLHDHKKRDQSNIKKQPLNFKKIPQNLSWKRLRRNYGPRCCDNK